MFINSSKTLLVRSKIYRCFIDSKLFLYFVIMTLDLAICSFMSLFWCHCGFQSRFFSCWSHYLILIWLSLTQFGSVWLNLAQFGSVCLSLPQFGLVWPETSFWFGSLWLTLCLFWHNSPLENLVWFSLNHLSIVWIKTNNNNKMAISRLFLAVFPPPVCLSFTKPRFRRSFWGA